MPEVGTLDFAVWILIVLSQFGLVFQLFRTGHWAQWLSMTAFMAFRCCLSSALLPLFLLRKECAYFYTFWAGNLFANALQVWILTEIACDLFAITPGLRRRIRFAVPGIAVLLLAGADVLASQVKIGRAYPITQIVMEMDRALSLAWCSTFLFIALIASAVGMRWSRTATGIATGFAVSTCGSVIASWAITAFGLHFGRLFSGINELLYLASLIVWIASFRNSERISSAPPDAVHVINRQLKAYSTVLRRIREEL